MNPLNRPEIKLWFELGGLLAEAAETGWRRAHKAFKPARPQPCTTRRPGHQSPMWNAFAALLRQELRAYGTKARLARYLGIPRQRLQDFLRAKSRLPDAELTLRMIHWLVEIRAGRNPAL